jgi:ribonucleoside-diphosphate reductase alpha chain
MKFKSDLGPFMNSLSETIFKEKYYHTGAETWETLAKTLVHEVCDGHMDKDDIDQLTKYVAEMKFIPGGRYLYYAGRGKRFYNNCYLLRAEEDTREDWANLSWKSESCLLTGGGIGVDYSTYRDSKQTIGRTGGRASGPIPKMFMVNEIGRNVIQGGSRRSAIYASLNWKHGDIDWFLKAKDWHNMPVAGTDKTVWDLKVADFNYNAPLDMTNISVNYDTEWLMNYNKTGDYGDTFLHNVQQALRTGEPGFSFNFFDKETETLRNACTEVTSSDDSDVCNLGSINLSRISDLDELADVVNLATKFLLCGTLKADLPYEKIKTVREKNRRLGLGLMGLHEWMLQRGYKYEVGDELHKWLTVFQGVSDASSRKFADMLGCSTPVANRAIAPTGTIGLLAGTTTGIEPLYAVAYKRRYLTQGTKWKYQYQVDGIAQQLIERYGLNPDEIETASDLATDYERRIKLQADVQDYVDMSISSTINLPSVDSQSFDAKEFAGTLARYASRLRGFTSYPDGARGGQPITKVDYKDAIDKLGEEFEEGGLEYNDICAIGNRGGTCGI